MTRSLNSCYFNKYIFWKMIKNVVINPFALSPVTVIKSTHITYICLFAPFLTIFTYKSRCQCNAFGEILWKTLTEVHLIIQSFYICRANHLGLLHYSHMWAVYCAGFCCQNGIALTRAFWAHKSPGQLPLLEMSIKHDSKAHHFLLQNRSMFFFSLTCLAIAIINCKYIQK